MSEKKQESQKLDHLFLAKYTELRRLAHKLVKKHWKDETLQPTEFLHEVYLKLKQAQHLQWVDEAHFFRISAQAIRQSLMDYAKKKVSLKQGGMVEKIPLESLLHHPEWSGSSLLVLEEALQSLSNEDPYLLSVVELKFFGGLTIEETSLVIGRSPASVKRDWDFARTWLFRYLQK